MSQLCSESEFQMTDAQFVPRESLRLEREGLTDLMTHHAFM